MYGAFWDLKVLTRVLKMFPEKLLENIPWNFSRIKYESLDDFLSAVTEYHADLEHNAEWDANEIAIEASQLAIIINEVYDPNEDEVDLEIDLSAIPDLFTNGGLFFSLHNALADKIQSGYYLGDHCYFEGLVHNKDGQYFCYLGS